jgi:hypothetical protein
MQPSGMQDAAERRRQHLQIMASPMTMPRPAPEPGPAATPVMTAKASR